jgi:hypothetical protein
MEVTCERYATLNCRLVTSGRRAARRDAVLSARADSQCDERCSQTKGCEGDIMKRYEMEQFQDSTCLLPHVIGERVADARGLSIEDATAFAEYVADRALELFNRSRNFRRKLLQHHRLECMYTFAEHWLDAEIQRGKYTPIRESNDNGNNRQQ